MGFYVNPPNESKEEFLERQGIEVPSLTHGKAWKKIRYPWC